MAEEQKEDLKEVIDMNKEGNQHEAKVWCAGLLLGSMSKGRHGLVERAYVEYVAEGLMKETGMIK